MLIFLIKMKRLRQMEHFWQPIFQISKSTQKAHIVIQLVF